MASSIRTAVHESLPYIDPEPSPSALNAAHALVAAELSSSQTPRPTLPPLKPSVLTPTLQSELDRIASGTPLSGIDSSRYELQDAPTSPSASELSQAYTTATYLSQRRTNLSLLDAYGKNAWLVSNWQTESELAALERDLADVKREIDLVTLERRRQQDAVRDEITGLEETWKRGVGRVLETEVATAALKQEVLERQRRSA